MKILHYSLGLPPYRSGGLTKYMMDLMEEQVNQKDEVYLLYPGKIRMINKDVSIAKNKECNGIKVFEIINPLPVPLLQGIKDIKSCTKKVDGSIYEQFLKKVNPDIIHIHSLMGIHKEFFEIAKKLHIKLVFTTHDYFGICPKSNLCNHKNETCEKYNNKDCSICCQKALSNKKIFIMQSHIYKKLKDTNIINMLRRKEKENIIQKEFEIKAIDKNQIINYNDLMEYYQNIFSYIDVFIFNSNLTKKRYMANLDIKNYCVIPVVHRNIQDNRIKKDYSNDEKIKIGYMGPQTEEKGFFILLKVLDKLYELGFEFSLDVFFKPIVNKPYIKEHDRYTYSELQEIYKNMDVSIVPSRNDTFGFIVLESISYGVPVISYKEVGATFILEENDAGYVYEDETELAQILKNILEQRDILKKWNQNILKMDNTIFNMAEHTKKIKEYAYKK